MRVLVEQTEQAARRLCEKLPTEFRPEIHVAMGGVSRSDWYLYPERPTIIIGTQDMLLSRALNRGYASSRARWPLEFSLLNHDALWVMDEVQLMDVGLATSAQLQAFREEDREKHLRPCHTWWMSATLQPDWLRSVDTETCHKSWIQDPIEVPGRDRHGGLWDIRKVMQTAEVDAGKSKDFARLILEEHQRLAEGEFGRITLVVCNTVDRACQTFDALIRAGRKDGLELVHSRFRPHDRKNWRDSFLSRSACRSGVDRILVATQVVEAGVDISAGCLITELAPWPSLVQRFGRCARYGGQGRVVVVDRGREKGKVAPYLPEEVESAWESLGLLTRPDVGIAELEAYEQALSESSRQRLYPYSPAHLLMRKEFDELFDTTPDLTGADLDISRFIRSDENERDLQLFWLELGKEERPADDRKARREELCAVPFLKARDWLCESKKSKLKSRMRAWVWDWLEGEWAPASREALLPGRLVCVASDCGGYQVARGFDPESSEVVPPVPPQGHASAVEAADDQQDGEEVSHQAWKTIARHTLEVVEQAREIGQSLALPARLQDLLDLAASWHDWGKAHQAFQGSIRSSKGGEQQRLDRQDLAKAPAACWPRKHLYQFLDDSDQRPGYRHELASALGLFAVLERFAPRHPALLGPWSDLLAMMGHSLPVGEESSEPHPLVQRLLACSAEEFNLVAYLVASHHGKVRLALHAAPKDQVYNDRDGRGLPIRGVREGDGLPGVALLPGQPPVPEVTLTLAPATLGLSPRTGCSWRERCLQLTERHGPAALAYLEAILCAADRRASQLTTNDPALATEVPA